jgi:hypothetical protein
MSYPNPKESFDFNRIAAKRLSEAEQQYIQLRLEKTKLNRERANNILNKGIGLYVIFTITALGVMYNRLTTPPVTNTLIVASLCILVLAIMPYLIMTSKEERAIDKILDSLMADK